MIFYRALVQAADTGAIDAMIAALVKAGLNPLAIQVASLKDSGVLSDQRAQVILTYALCGFSNLASIGILIGGIGALAPNQRSTLAQLGLKALLGGSIACFLTACVASMLT